MRIIAGKFRGRILKSFPGRKVRPTSDRLRETLFNILQSDIHSGASVWDAFAGTGALGLEALSRGADRVVFTEQDRTAFARLKENIRLLGVTGQVEPFCADALVWITQASRSFDLIFLDPPYDWQSYLELGRAIGRHGLCRPGAKVVLEHDRRSAPAAEMLDAYQPYRQVRQGDSILSFLEGEAFAPTA